MINTFIAAIVAMFFWGKSTKDVEEKTQLASWTRTIVYFVLALAVGAFYVKTNEVAIVSKNIQVMDARRCIDSNKNVIDTIENIEIRNVFSSDLIENRLGYNKLSSAQKDSIRKKSNKGGIYIVQSYFNKRDCKIETIEEFRNELCQIDKHTFMPFDSLSHVYQICCYSTSIPSLVPLYPKFHKEHDSYLFDNNKTKLHVSHSDYESYPYDKKQIVITRDLHGNDNEDDVQTENPVESTVYTARLYSFIKNVESYHCIYLNEDNFSNNLNFFTAADISQYTCFVSIETPCYVKELNLMYDLPIEINSYDSCMAVESHHITVNGAYLNNKNDNIVQLGFHIKFPTLANLQLIRSLILTTLLTALVSLFLLNLFYRVRKHAINFKEEHVTQISEVRVKSFKIKMHLILYMLLILLCYLSWRIYNDNPFHLKIEFYDWLLANYAWLIPGFILILLIITYFLFRKAYTISNKKKK